MNFNEAKNKLLEAAQKHALFNNLALTNGKIVIGRGQKENPEFLFLGEAPGQEENQQGKPFVGRSGKILDGWIEAEQIKSYCIINTLPIIPLDAEQKIRTPTDEEIAYFRPYVKDLIKAINPKYIICVGKSATRSLQIDFQMGVWRDNIGFIYHPSWYMRNGKNGNDDFKKLIQALPKTKEEYMNEISFQNITDQEALDKFLSLIGAQAISKESFIHGNKKWFVDYHPFSHSDDIIIHEDIVNEFDNFLLIKTGSDKVRIPGWTTKEKLLSTPKRDIYGNNKFYYMVVDSNLNDLTNFKISSEHFKVLKKEFIINQQTAENLGHSEMISGILSGLHSFAKKAGLYFKDINQKDECIIGTRKAKIYTRDVLSDEDMLIYEEYYQKHPEIDIYICCKIKGGNYNYIGFIEKEVVDNTRVVQMIGQDSDLASNDIRRIFAEQYKNLSEFIRIFEEEKSEDKVDEPQDYVPLHLHTEFSVGDGFGKIKYIAEQLYKRGFKGAAITDHGTLAGTWEFQKALLEKNLKPIIGCEFYVKYKEEEKRHHLTVLVKSKKGWENILKLQSIAVRDGFYYKPILPIYELLKHKEGLIVLSGCSSCKICKLLDEGREQEAEEVFNMFLGEFGEDFYAEIQPHNIETNQRNMQVIFGYAQKHNVKCVFTTDTHYAKKEDKKYHDAIKAIDLKKEYGAAGYGDDCFFLMQRQDIEEKLQRDAQWMLPYYKEFLKNTSEVFDKCSFKIEPVPENDTLPKIEFDGISRAEKFKQMCIEGLAKNTPYKYEGAIKDRLDLEMDRMLDKQYENYFLIVADMINWAKENGIRCGPGRGSVGASLVAYALKITETDPIKYDLLFDRFISSIRRDAPDCDMDFMDVRRDEIFNYLRKKYGENHCAKIVTYSRFHAKGIMRDAGRILKIPILEIEKINNLVIERSGGDARASFTLIDTFSEFKEAKAFAERYPLAVDIAVRLEGHIRHKGVHAAAMVVAEKDVSGYIPITKVGGEIVTEWEKQLAEDAKLIKFDILGLRTLTIIDDCIKTAKCILPKEFNDLKVYENVFKSGKTIGVFQFNTVGMTKFTQMLQVDTFNDLYDATTIFRPGALHSGQAMIYANRKLGREEVTYMHKTLEPITCQTRGVILYQEQIMQIMNQTGGMSWATAEMARKVITKSKGKDAFNKMREEFVRNANRIHGMPTEEAERLYDVVSTFGSYSFNKAHAVEYSIISYVCAWLKTYYPQHFYKSILKYENDSNTIQDIAMEMERAGIFIEYPDINKSDFSYEITDDKIYAGFNSIIGIGEKTARKIIKNRPYASIEDFKKRAKVSEKLFKALVIADAFREFNICKQAYYLDRPDLDEEFSDIEWAQRLYEATTLKPKLNILKTYNFGDYEFINIRELNEQHGGKQKLLRGLVTVVINKDRLLRTDLSNHTHQFERHMIYLNLNDGTGNIAIQINPATYEKYASLLQVIEKQPIIALAVLSKDGKKAYGDILQIVSESHRTYDIDNIYNKLSELKPGEAFITSAQPAVSKNQKSYYRIILSNEKTGLCFRFTEKLFPGMKVKYRIIQEPFMDLEVIR